MSATLLLAAAIAAIGAVAVLWSPARTGFVLGAVIGTNASAVVHARHGVPAFLLPLAVAAIGAGALRLVAAGGGRRPATRLPIAAVGVVGAIVWSAALGPYVSDAARSSAASVDRLLTHLIVVIAVAVVAGRRPGFSAVLIGLATGGAILATLTNLQTLLGARDGTLLGFGAWNRETIGGRGTALRAAGPFGDDPNAYAQYLVVMAAIAVGWALTAPAGRPRWHTWTAWVAVASMVAAIAQTASRGGLIGLAIVGLTAVVVTGADARRIGAAAVAGALLLLVPGPIRDRLATLTTTSPATGDSGLRGRTSEMLAAVEMFLDHPVAGVGYGTYNDRYLDYSRGLGIDPRFEERSAHSLPLEIAAEQGLIGLAAWSAFAVVAIVVVVRLRRHRADLGTPLGLAWVGFAGTAMFLHDVHPRLMWCLVGLVIAGARILDRATETRRTLAAGAPIRVAAIIQSYVPAVGGAERQLANLMPLLRARGVRPMVVTRSMPGRPRADVVDGVPVLRLWVAGPKPVRSMLFVLQARVALERFDPHVVHAFDTLTPSSIAIGHRSRTAVPVVTKILRSGELGDLQRLARKPFGRWRRRSLVGRVDAFVAISSDIDAELAELGVAPERRAAIPNGVDTDRFRPAEPGGEDATGRSPVTVVATGRLAPEKRLTEIAERWHRVTDRVPGTRLVIAGDGPERSRLEDVGGVELVGTVTDVAALLRRCDVYASASRAEGLSNSLLEAMATGLPCVVTDVGGVRDVVTDPGEGVLVDAGDLDGLVDAIADLVADRSRRRAMGATARGRAVRSFGLAATADSLVDLYTRLVHDEASGGRRPRPRSVSAPPGGGPTVAPPTGQSESSTRAAPSPQRRCPIVCVTGMHKSGTTLVAEILHHSGIHMADVPEELGYDESNKYERHEAQRINRRLLRPVLVPTVHGYRLRDAGLDRAGYEINVDSVAWVRRRRLRRVVAETPTAAAVAMVTALDAEHARWGFKDPRTCLTYGWWRRGLPEHRLVAVYRPFGEVLMRYGVGWTSPVRLLRVARSWIVHNELLLEHLRGSDDHILLRYDELMRADGELDRLQEYLGTPLTDRRRPDLYRARSDRATEGAGPVWLPRPILARAARIEGRLEGFRRS